ncbi:hypothetical protein F2P81_008935 [Scophthalmus maximus]|uniref:Uncharacterized protein n=1 Tax=Scophthalmus maximus TaxID=52904 RepID=A0A6A4T5Q8_SCOMX|nr:hypothetical protein F2P81_008935 [Scophthalmus maximus]
MEYFTTLHQKMMSAFQVTVWNQQPWMEGQTTNEVMTLNTILIMWRENYCREYIWRIHLSQDLEETKQQLAKQKQLTEMFINKGKETRKELEMLQKYSIGDTLNTSKIATQVSNKIKRKKKKDLQNDYEELQVALTTSQEKSNTELQEERNTSKVLQEELEKLRASYKELNQKYEADILTARQLAEILKHELEAEKMSHEDRVSQDEFLAQFLRVEQDALRRKIEEDIRMAY